MLVLRLLGLLAVLAVGGSVVLWLVTGDPRYRGWAWRAFRVALVVLFHSDRQVAWIACIPVALFAAYWFMKRRGSPVLVPADAANPRA